MSKRKWTRIIAVLMALGLIAAACGSDSGDVAAGDAPAEEAQADESEQEAPAEEVADDEEMAVDDHSLVGICPDPLVVQTDWFPEPEHGYTYQLIGPNGEIDAENGVYSGPLGDTGITMEIRAGGPYIGFSPPSAQIYSDDSIFMGYAETSNTIITSETLPLVAVMAPFEISPQMLMWNPEIYDFESFEDIAESGAPVLYFEGTSYMPYLLGQDFLTEDQVDASYDGSPARFLVEDVVQQGFASNELYRYENEIEGWQKPVDFLLIYESGFETYEGALSVKPESITEQAECLERVVPMFQQAQVDYMNDPEPMNVRLDEIVKALDSFWTSSVDGHAAATVVMRDLGLVSDGSDSTIGNMEFGRIQALIDIELPLLADLGIETFRDGLTAEDIATNQFIDMSIGLGF